MTHPLTSQPPNQPTIQPPNPYVGPRTFTAADRARFFGREREARDLLARVLSERLLLFYAQSGAGKSSLLNARLIPQLQEERGFVVLPVARVSGELPAGVTQVDNIFVFNLLLSIDEGDDPARLAHVTLADFLARLTRRPVAGSQGQERRGWVYDAGLAPASAAAGGRRYALIVDQFEEIITGHPAQWRQREEFFRQLDAALAADPNLWVVLTLREDYVAALDPYAPLVFNRLRGRFYMERMGVAAALDAVRKPAELAGRPFAAGVAEQLVDNLRQVRVPGQEAAMPGQYVEPVQLQVVCYQLWENLAARSPLSLAGRGDGGEGQVITFADLAVAGDVDRALTQFYEGVIQATVNAPEVQALQRSEPDVVDRGIEVPRVTEYLLRQWFSNELITTGGVRNMLLRDDPPGWTGTLPNVAVVQLERRYLLRSEAHAGRYWVELMHDRLVDPILKANEPYLLLAAQRMNPYDIPGIVQEASRKVLERYQPLSGTITEDRHAVRSQSGRTGHVVTLAAAMIADWIEDRTTDIVTWLASLVRNLPSRIVRLMHTLVSSLWASITVVPSGVQVAISGGRRVLGTWLIQRLWNGTLRVITVLLQVLDLIGIPEVFGLLWRTAVHTTPLTYYEVITLTHLLGPKTLRYGDVRVADGGILRLVFGLKWFRQQGTFTLFHTINVMNKSQFGFHRLLFEIVQVSQYERLGSLYLLESAIADLTSGYGYGGIETLREDLARGKRYRDYNRLQQATIVATYFSAMSYGQDVSALEPLVDAFRAGDL